MGAAVVVFSETNQPLYLIGSSPLVIEGQFLIRLDPDDVEKWFGQ